MGSTRSVKKSDKWTQMTNGQHSVAIAKTSGYRMGEVSACERTRTLISRWRRKAYVPILTAFFLLGIIGCTRSVPDATELLRDAQRFYAEGNRNAAIIQLKNALGQDPKNVEARFLLGKSYLENGDLPAAENQLRNAIDLG